MKLDPVFGLPPGDGPYDGPDLAAVPPPVTIRPGTHAEHPQEAATATHSPGQHPSGVITALTPPDKPSETP